MLLKINTWRKSAQQCSVGMQIFDVPSRNVIENKDMALIDPEMFMKTRQLSYFPEIFLITKGLIDIRSRNWAAIMRPIETNPE